jgi:Flp pilus assembly secretin CpaC
MKPSVVSKVGSILISTTLVIAFAIVQAPLRNAAPRDVAGVVVRKPVQDVNARKKLSLTVGKSLIVDSRVEIVRATVADPDLADTVALDSHELLVNAKVVGETTLTLWQQDGKQRAFDLKVAVDLQSTEDARYDFAPLHDRQTSKPSYRTDSYRNVFSAGVERARFIFREDSK